MTYVPCRGKYASAELLREIMCVRRTHARLEVRLVKDLIPGVRPVREVAVLICPFEIDGESGGKIGVRVDLDAIRLTVLTVQDRAVTDDLKEGNIAHQCPKCGDRDLRVRWRHLGTQLVLSNRLCQHLTIGQIV